MAYYDEVPVETRGKVEIHQLPISSAAGLRSSEGAIRASVAYVPLDSETGRFLVPFGAYDDWSLRDRYNEAIRIMNTLGASSITCETYGERSRPKWRTETAPDREQRVRLPPQRHGKRATRPETASVAG